MGVLKAIKGRYSCRSYQQKPIEKEKLNQLLEAARLAPSAHNDQEWKLVVVSDGKKRKLLAQAAGQSFIGQAPIVIAAVSSNPQDMMSSGNPSYAVDLAIAVDHLTLAAAELKLGTCWIGAFDQAGVKRILEIPDRCQTLVLLPLGYPADRPGPKTRKDLSEIVSQEKFGLIKPDPF